MPFDDVAKFLRNTSCALIRPLLVAAGLLGLGCGWLSLTPTAAQSDNDVGTTIAVQMERAASRLPADVILVGDSTCLLGIDAGYLGQLLGGRRVESLCNLVFAGARGYAALLDQYFAAGNQTEYVVLAMHPVGLNYDHDNTWDQWEKLAMSGALPRQHPVDLRSFLPDLRARLPAKVGQLPFAGDYGQYYGTPRDYVDYLKLHHGSAFSPLPSLPVTLTLGAGDSWTAALRPDKYVALSDLATHARVWPVEKIFFYVPPIAAGHATEHTYGEYGTLRQAIAAIFHSQAVKNFVVLDTPPYERSEYFTDLSHPSRQGRPVVTRELASALVEDGAWTAQPLLEASQARWGGLIDLTGFAIDRSQATPGGTLKVTLAWRRVAPISTAYTTFVHLYDSSGQLVAQRDQPPRNGIRPTNDWWEDEQVTDHFDVSIPYEIAAGDYRIRVGWYSAAGDRLSVRATPSSAAEDGLDLGTIPFTGGQP